MHSVNNLGMIALLFNYLENYNFKEVAIVGDAEYHF
jgi:hypothetical protein